MEPGDIVGHEPMGVVEEVGAAVHHLDVGDRVVIPFNVSLRPLLDVRRDSLQSQCETTQNPEHGTGASLLGYSKLYGQVPGGQAEYLRVPHADYGAIKVPNGPPDDRFLFLSDVLPTAWQAVEYADVPEGGTRAGARRRADRRHGGPDRDAPRPPGARRRTWCRSGSSASPRAAPRPSTSPASAARRWRDVVRDKTDGRGADAVIDAVGMEAHGSRRHQGRPEAGRPAAGQARPSR